MRVARLFHGIPYHRHRRAGLSNCCLGHDRSHHQRFAFSSAAGRGTPHLAAVWALARGGLNFPACGGHHRDVDHHRLGCRRTARRDCRNTFPSLVVIRLGRTVVGRDNLPRRRRTHPRMAGFRWWTNHWSPSRLRPSAIDQGFSPRVRESVRSPAAQ